MFIVFSDCARLYLWLCAACTQPLSHGPNLCDPKAGSLPDSSSDFSGKNAGVSCHFLLQGTFLTQGSLIIPPLYFSAVLCLLSFNPFDYICWRFIFIRLLKNQASFVPPLLCHFFFLISAFKKIFSLFLKCLFCSLNVSWKQLISVFSKSKHLRL